MHLLNARTRKVEHFIRTAVPLYAILSHTWGDEEVTMQDLISETEAESKAGYTKIRFACDQALRDELYYVWIDCCCIDKTSSTELSEAINSMFRWYSRAAICYAYLSDVTSAAEPHASSSWTADNEKPCALPDVSQSRWFIRGWTLQELIAPKDVVFFDRAWSLIGTRNGNLLQAISQFTNIDLAVLQDHSRLPEISVAKRMSWAANRRTTRKEDEAYCLLGIFGVNMALLYGEEEKAFIRLQEEIIRSSTDQSIFAWKREMNRSSGSLLAPSARYFASCHSVFLCAGAPFDDPFEITNAGLRISLPLIEVRERETHIGVLNCHQNGKLLALSLALVEIGVFNRAKPTYSVSTNFWYSNPACVSVENAVTTKKSSIVIVRREPVSSRNEARPINLWLRLKNVVSGPTLSVEGVYPRECWDLSGMNRDVEGDHQSGGDVIAQFTPRKAEKWRYGGIACRVGEHRGCVLICFHWPPGTWPARPSLKMKSTRDPNIEEFCKAVQKEPPAPGILMKSSSHSISSRIVASVQLGICCTIHAALKSDERVLDDSGLVLELSPAYTQLGLMKSGILQSTKKSR